MNNLPSTTQVSVNDDVFDIDPSTSADRAEVEQILQSIKNDLLEGIKEGIDAELQEAGPEARSQMEQNQEYFRQLLEAIEEGMTLEIQEFISSERELNEETIKDLTERLADISQMMAEGSSPVPVEDAEVVTEPKQEKVAPVPTNTTTGGSFIRDVLLTSIGLGDFAERLNKPASADNPPSRFTAPEIDDVYDQEEDLEDDLMKKSEYAEIRKQTILLTEIRNYAKLLEPSKDMIPTDPSSSGAQGGFELPGMGGKAGGAIRAAGKFLLPAAAVAGAGYLGFKGGEILNEQVLNPLAGSITGDETDTVGTALYKGVDKVKSFFGAGEEDRFEEAARQSEISLATSKLESGQPISRQLADKVRGYGLEVPEEMIVDPSSRRTLPQSEGLSEGETIVGPGVDRTSKLMETGVPSASETAAEIGRNITVQTPPPVVIPAPSAPTPVIMPPFTQSIRNNEPTITSYIRRRFTI